MTIYLVFHMQAQLKKLADLEEAAGTNSHQDIIDLQQQVLPTL